ncbi:MAG: hypothetical protein RSD49_04850 [Hafnia sp.]
MKSDNPDKHIPYVIIAFLVSVCVYLSITLYQNHVIKSAEENLTPEKLAQQQEAKRIKRENDLAIIKIKEATADLEHTRVYCSATGVAYWMYTYATPQSIAPAFSSDSEKPMALLDCETAEKILAEKTAKQKKLLINITTAYN